MGGGCGGDGSDGGGAVTAVTINVSCTDGTKFTVQVSLDSSVQSFKSLLAKTCDIPAEEQRLIYKGGILKDDQTLKSYGILLQPYLIICLQTPYKMIRLL